MPHDLPHLASRIYATPLLIARPKLEVILGVIGPRLAGEPLSAGQQDPAPHGPAGFRVTEAGIAVVPVLGTLVRRSSYLASISGLTAYHDIEAMAAGAFADPRVLGVLLEIDSCGGEAGGVFDLAEGLREMRKAFGKPLWAVADEAALSAAYAIAAAADRIWLPRTAEAGSVGVVAVHVDESEADRQAGLAYTFIHAGSRKVDGHPHAPLTGEARAGIQADVDALYEQFVAMVARLRGLSPEAVRATEARTFRGPDAVRAGLADTIGTFAQAHDALAACINTQTSRKELKMDKNETPEVAASAQAAAAHVASHVAADVAADAEVRVIGRMGELNEIAAQAKRLGVTVDAAKALTEGVAPDDLRRQVLREAADRSAAEDILAVHPVKTDTVNLAESPLVKAAKAMKEATR